MGTIYDEIEPKIYGKIVQTLQGETPILDVGCGEGRLVNFLAVKLRRKIFGVDISSGNFSEARKEAELKNVSHLVKYMKSDATNLHVFKEGSFGGVVNVYTLHEFKDPATVLGEVKRVLKRGGKLVIVDFVKGGEAERLWGERYYTPEEIKSMLECSGFHVVGSEFLYNDVIFIHISKK